MEETILEIQAIDTETILLKQILKKQRVMAWAGFIWIRTGSCSRFLLTS
jgi:hypothetical protein